MDIYVGCCSTAKNKYKLKRHSQKRMSQTKLRGSKYRARDTIAQTKQYAYYVTDTTRKLPDKRQ